MERPALDEALTAFKTASQGERIQFLDKLFHSFRPSEKYAMRDKLEADNYFFDIFGSLPLEISLQIAEALDPTDIINLRRVSSRWKSLLSSPHLARKVVQMHYSRRSDLPSYSQQLKQDPFSVLRNMAFKDYAGEAGLCKLRTRFDFSSTDIPQCKESLFPALNLSADFRYAIFDCIRQDSTSDTYQWYLIDMNKGQNQQPMPLVNRNKEILGKGSVHVGTCCAAGVTTNSGRVLVWNMQGGIIREFRLLHQGDMAICSSERYLCIRNEHGGTDYSDYYIVNLQTSSLQVFERITDFVKFVTPDTLADWPPMMILGNRIVVADMYWDEEDNHQVAVSWLTFIEEEGTLIETGRRTVKHDLPNDLYRFRPAIAFRNGMDTARVDTSSLNSREPDVVLTISPNDSVSVSWIGFNPALPIDHGLIPPVTEPFRFKETVYIALHSTDETGRSLEKERGPYRYSLWRSGRNKKTSSNMELVLNLADMSGPLGDMRPHDSGFAAIYEGGLQVYDWLDFDGFMELGGSKSTRERALEVLVGWPANSDS
ncbi:hypothetical protein TWF481_008956 [Arthrobotrys musiformis]|uniref:F-box domain-containing protein n=1 Tax=Arthrobotrys musiformis TaxID=47236 RepID=A0AAV9W267_9PEZI